MSDDVERVAVKCYVPRYQKELWEADADDMDMSLSEFVRCMVQAGRRGFDTAHLEDELAGEHEQAGSELVGLDESTLRERILAMLERADHLTHEEIVLLVTSDVEEATAGALEALQTENVVLHGPGGYRLADGAQ